MADIDLTGALRALKALQSRLSDLREALETAGATSVVYALPRASNDPDEGDISDLLVDPTEPISVEVITGAEARRRALAMYGRLERRRDQPPTRPDRLPGIVTTHFRPAAALARAVNRAKDDLAAEIAALPRASSRAAELFHGTDLHHVLLLQAYRHIGVITDPVEAVSFGWTRRSRVITQLQRAEALRLIAGASDGSEGSSEWRDIVADVGDPLLARVRNMPPHPFVNIQIDGNWAKHPNVAMPILIVGSAPNTIRHLGDYQPDRQPRAQRPMMIRQEPLIPKLRLYRYEPRALATAIERRRDREQARTISA